MAKNTSLSIDAAWNAVALEERIALISRAHAQGVLAAAVCVGLFGSAAYGFDKIWMLAMSIFAALMIIPLFSSFSWRRNKASTILQYLAVRSIARRYAFGFNITDLDIILIFRGQMEERYHSMEEEMLLKTQREDVDLDAQVGGQKDVWICLMRGAVAILSERTGGAKLEFFTTVAPEVKCRAPEPADRIEGRAVIIDGVGIARGRTVIITSEYPGALYVFEKQLQRLIFECIESRRQLLEMVDRHRP